MILRTCLIFAALVVGVGAVVAQSDPMKERKDIMKGMGMPFYVTLNRMRRGQAPYNQATVDDAFAFIAANAPKLPTLYPDSTKNVQSTDDYGPSAKLWENKADFDKRVGALVKVAAENQSRAKNVDGLKVAFANVRKECDSCHETYRVEKK